MARHNAKHEKRKTSSEVRKPAKSRKTVKPEEQAQYCRKIKTFLQMTARKQINQKELAQKCHSKRSPAAFQAAVSQLLKEGVLIETRQNYKLCSQEETFHAETVRLSGNFGFIRDEAGTEHFVPGKFLLGSMTGDKVLAKSIPSRTGSPEAEILSILEETPQARLSGVIVATEYGLCFLSGLAGTPLHIDYHESCPYKIGDKVLAEVTFRGSRHMEHIVKIILNFGSADSAENCMKARIAELDIPTEFTESVQKEAFKVSAVGVTEFDMQGRLDLRDEVIFTIDGAYSKDLDDAVSVKKHENGWTLGVHIADVSHYVRPDSRLDAEAFQRGTSIYYANQVIPMLPKQLSNGICSLNPGKDRLTLSAVMEISPEGDLLEYDFYQSVIRSRVKGVYDECNQILNHTASPEIQEKYAEVTETLFLLDELTEKLEHVRKLRGAPGTRKHRIRVDSRMKRVSASVFLPVRRGRSERIIEACMLCANEAAAKIARENQFPLVYRVHENPAPERIAALKELLLKLNQQELKLNPEEVTPADIQKLLDDAREESYFPVVNALTLRAMAKARYSEKPLGHFGLALADYAHFTSPIRRYPDLTVHRILSDFLDGADKEWLIRTLSEIYRKCRARVLLILKSEPFSLNAKQMPAMPRNICRPISENFSRRNYKYCRIWHVCDTG